MNLSAPFASLHPYTITFVAIFYLAAGADRECNVLGDIFKRGKGAGVIDGQLN